MRIGKLFIGALVGILSISSNLLCHADHSFPIQLNTGWNLISIPVMPADTTVGSVLSSLQGKYSIVWYYEGDTWYSYDPDSPGLSDLYAIEPGKGYWIEMTSPASLVVSGEAVSAAIPIRNGWNLVGVNSRTEVSVSRIVDPAAPPCTIVWGYESDRWRAYDTKIPALSDLDLMQPGHGYWIKADDTTWLNFTAQPQMPRIAVHPSDLYLEVPSSLDPPAVQPRSAAENEANDLTHAYPHQLNIPEEVVKYWEQNVSPPTSPPGGSFSFPATQDWSRFDSPVKSQGACGSCWAFVTTALLENLARRKNIIGNVQYLDLSEQELVSCAVDRGCSGGWYWEALEHIYQSGAVPESCYPYVHRNGSCDDVCLYPPFLLRIPEPPKEYGLWGEDHDVDDIRRELQHGAICASMRVPDDGTFVGDGYKGGIYDYDGGFIPWSGNGHAILIVGYDDNQQFFKAKNTWGPYWGENGYFRISYDDVEDDVKFGSYGYTISDVYVVFDEDNQYVTISNQGSTDLNITGIRTSTDWLNVQADRTLSIPPNGSETIIVFINHYDRISPSNNRGTISINSNDPASPQTIINVEVKLAPLRQEDIKGDLNGDTEADMADVIIGLQVLAGGSPYIRADYANSNADVDEDSNKHISFPEVFYLLQKISNNSAQ